MSRTVTYREKYRNLYTLIDVLRQYKGNWRFSGTQRRIRREFDTLKEFDVEVYNQLSLLFDRLSSDGRSIKKEKVEKLHSFVEEVLLPLYEPFERESYHYLTIGGIEFKFKAIRYSSEAIYFGLFSFKTKQHAKSLISLVNDGKSFQIRDQFFQYKAEGKITDKKAYKLQLMKSDEKNGDGYHGRLFLDKKNIIRIFDHEEPKYFDLFDIKNRNKDRFYNLLKNTKDAALLTLPKKGTKTYQSMLENVNVSEEELIDIVKVWKNYFYERFEDQIHYRGRFYGNEKYLPKVYEVRNSMISDDDIRTCRTKGLKRADIILPIEKRDINENMTFLDIITKFVIKDIEDEEYHFNIGDDIESVINSKINMEEGKTSYLFGKQKIIGQGMVNAMDAGEHIIFLNGGTGVGKTFTSTKSSLQYLEHTGQLHGKFRVAIYAQGHLIPKWKRQIEQAISPLGIKPIFRNVNYLREVDSLPIEPEGAEFLFFSKDKAKRSYSIKYTAENKYPTLVPIDNFIEKYKKYEDHDLIEELGTIYDKLTIINAEHKIPNNQLKYTALRLAKFSNKHIIIYNQLDDNKFVFSTSIKRFNDAFSKENRKKYFKTSSMKKPIKVLLSPNNIEVLEDTKTITKGAFSNPLVCPDCGLPIYSHFNNRFKDDKSPRHKKYTSRSKSNAVCNAPLYPNGKAFDEEFIKIVGNRKAFKMNMIKEIDPEVPLFLDHKKEPIKDSKEISLIKRGILPRSYRYVYINYVSCGYALWAADSRKGKRDKMRNVNVGKHLKRHFRNKRFIDVLIADECHIYSKQSNQGYLYHLLVEQSKKTLNLSATITGGKASDLYYMFWRTMPKKMRRMGYEYDDYNMFVENYGRYEKKSLLAEDKTSSNKTGTIKRVYKGKKEIAGISPRLYTNFLNNIMISRKLKDMDIPMVDLNTFKEEFDVDSDLKKGYDDIKDDLLEFGQKYKVNIGGAFLHGLLSYLDNPNQPPIYFNNLDKLEGKIPTQQLKSLRASGQGFLITKPNKIDLSDRLLKKEKSLLKTLDLEIKQEGRKVLIYDRYSGNKAVSDRILKVVIDAGYKAIQLKSKVPTTKREEWIEQKHQEGYDIIITNPKIVQTGLDIIQYPTIYFYNYDFDVRVIRQAEKRPWRPNQDKECRIYYSYYKETIQQKAIQLIAKKKSASLALEGVFNEDMLSSMGSSESTSISKQLYDALKGKISMKEDHLEGLGIKSSNDLVKTLENKKEKEYNKVVVENDVDNDVEEITDAIEVKIEKVAVGQQLSFF